MKDFISEVEIITKYIEGSGYRVKNISYLEDSIAYMGAGNYYIGSAQGYIDQHQFFYGHLSIEDEFQGVINLANRNQHLIIFSTQLYGAPALVETARISFCVGSGSALLGDGNYIGNRRLYNVGCNMVTFGEIGCGAALFTGNLSFNGLIWTII